MFLAITGESEAVQAHTDLVQAVIHEEPGAVAGLLAHAQLQKALRSEARPRIRVEESSV